ncbi:concanavalin A-like lectin/glucanase domain-containing protein [Mycena galopus ATCC 62051]|nr:concanavalin A-like lectin/glucanase domain-containing protein [Mycena galopus ATCC 62051]
MSASTFGVLALVASASAHTGFKRMSQHARIAALGKRAAVSGIAYYGYQNNTMNACGTFSKDTDMIIGVGPDYYGDMSAVSSNCFQHITVALASDPSTSIDVTLTDACEDCGAAGNVYLSPSAFEILSGGSLEAGILDVTWTFANGTTSTASTSTASTSSDDDDDDCDDESDDGSSTVDTTTAVAEAAATPASTKEVAPTSTKEVTPTSTKEATTTPTSTKETSTAAPTSKAAAKTTSASATKATTTAASTSTSSEGWKLKSTLEGSSFLDFFNYDSGTGDNSGVANYVNGVSEGLAYTSGDQVILAVDTAEDVSARNSLRMVSKTTFNAVNQNLFIFDIAAMPAVCGTWPAVWFTGANWPYQGEIDVVEGVSLYNQNIYSVHTGSGCTIPDSSVSAMTEVTIVQSTGGTNCDATVDPAGCGFTDKKATTFGPGFNAAGGGVFALEFDTSGIKTWFWQTGSVPSDVTSKAPNPSTWGSPRMSVPTSSCSPTTYFSDLMMVVDTNLGGTFTEGVWDTNGAGGQATSCKSQTGADSAADYVLSHGSEFGDAAQWKINGFYIYNQ